MSTTWGKNVVSIDRHEAQADQDRDHRIGALRGAAILLLVTLPFWALVAYEYMLGILR